MEEWAKRCAALEAERKTLAASIEDTAAAFDESLASLAQVWDAPLEVLATKSHQAYQKGSSPLFQQQNAMYTKLDVCLAHLNGERSSL